MKIKIIPEQVSEEIDSEEELIDQSKWDIIYEIRALKAAIELRDVEIEIGEDQYTSAGQVFIASHNLDNNKSLSIWSGTNSSSFEKATNARNPK